MMDVEDDFKNYRYLQGRVVEKATNLSVDELRALLAEYEQAVKKLTVQRSNQFPSVINRLLACGRDRQQIGIVLRQFAEHVLAESRLIGIKARDTEEEIVDQIPDMGGAQEGTGEEAER